MKIEFWRGYACKLVLGHFRKLANYFNNSLKKAMLVFDMNIREKIVNSESELTFEDRNFRS